MQTLSRYFTFQVLNVFLVTTVAGFAIEVRAWILARLGLACRRSCFAFVLRVRASTVATVVVGGGGDDGAYDGEVGGWMLGVVELVVAMSLLFWL